jgi:hypothetical protein
MEPLAFGPLEPLVAMIQETPTNRLLPGIVHKLQSGTELRRVLAAAALANARTFGGEDVCRLPHHDGPGPRLPHGGRTSGG